MVELTFLLADDGFVLINFTEFLGINFADFASGFGDLGNAVETKG